LQAIWRPDFHDASYFSRLAELDDAIASISVTPTADDPDQRALV
jgi:hypothetical protein